MSIPVLTFFNNKGGVGKTSLVYHLSWMFARRGLRVVAVDLDAQANLTAAFLDEDAIAQLWDDTLVNVPNTIFRAIKPLTAVGDLQTPIVQRLADNLHLVPGDVALSRFEDELSTNWSGSLGDKELYRPFRIITAFWQVAQLAAETVDADLIVLDVGPNLGAINRSALIASDYVAVPLGADIFSLQGLKNLGPTLRDWRKSWDKRRSNWETPDYSLPLGRMKPLGYLVQQHSVRLSRPVKAYDKWVNRMPGIYYQYVLEQEAPTGLTPETDPKCLATIKHYRSLVPMAQDVRKPIFELTSADGAIGAHAQAVTEARRDFEHLANKFLASMGLAIEQEGV